MKIRNKLLFGNLMIILSIGFFSVFLIYQLSGISQFVNLRLPVVIADLNNESYLNDLAQYIRYYDEVLTQSARNYAFTGDQIWKDRYYSVVDDLDKKINEAIDKGDSQDKKYFSSINSANLTLVGLEERSFALADNKQLSEAIAVLNSDEYNSQKKIYTAGLNDYLSRRGLKFQDARIASTGNLTDFQAQSERMINYSLRVILVGLVLILLVISLVSLLVIKSISRPLSELVTAIKEITSGKLERQVVIKANDEIGALAKLFNIMTKKLKDSSIKTEAKIAERTAELTKLNKFMTGRELKMIELKKEIQSLKSNNKQ